MNRGLSSPNPAIVNISVTAYSIKLISVFCESKITLKATGVGLSALKTSFLGKASYFGKTQTQSYTISSDPDTKSNFWSGLKICYVRVYNYN